MRSGSMDFSTVHERERGFHDALAHNLDPANMPPEPPDRLEAALLALTGDVAGRPIVDLGCGVGDLSLHLLQRGARVTGLDLSPGMIEIARRRADLFTDGSFEGVAATVEATGLPAGGFDLVVGKWILHHVELEPALEEVTRLLAPGGTAIFIENSALNPVLMFARRHLTGRFGIPRFGTEDEHPLDKGDYKLMRRHHPSLRLEFPEFTFFRLFDRQVLHFRYPRASGVISRVDKGIYERMPRLRRYSFRVLVVLGA